MTTTREKRRSSNCISTRIFDENKEEFRRLYNKKSFQFQHRLSGHPLFELPRLATLAETLLHKEGPGSIYCGEMATKGGREQIASAIADLGKSGARLLLYRTQVDPEYRALMDQVIDEVGEIAGVAVGKQVTWRDAYIFMASPFLATPYHIDHECTFLFQIHGQRVANIWDREDRTVLTDRELENYYAGYTGAAKYKADTQNKASVYSMVPGIGVHHPVLAPHAFKNGPTYSIALGVHYCLKDWDRHARIYQVNACLRRLHLKPTPPGRSAWRDKAKIRAVGLLSKRKPKNKFELIRSGFIRMTYPLRMVPGFKKRFST